MKTSWSTENINCHFKAKPLIQQTKFENKHNLSFFNHYIQPKYFTSFLIWQLGICLPLTQLCCLAALLICCCHPWKTGLWVAWSGLPPCGWQQVGAVAAGGWQSWQLCLSARLWANAMSSSMSPAFLQKIIVSDLYPSSYKVLSDTIWILFYCYCF